MRASAPTAGACSRASARPLGTRHNTAAAPGPPRRPASSAWQTRPKDAARHGRSYAQSYTPGFSGHLSLSRLNHCLPWGQAYPEVVQRTAEFHHQITDPLLPQADPVLHDAAALDTTVDMLDPQPTLVQLLVRHVLLPRELLAAGLLGRHEDLHLGEREGQEA